MDKVQTPAVNVSILYIKTVHSFTYGPARYKSQSILLIAFLHIDVIVENNQSFSIFFLLFYLSSRFSVSAVTLRGSKSKYSFFNQQSFSTVSTGRLSA